MSNKSNRELAEEALAYGMLLAVAVTTEGLKNPQLVDLVEGLKAKADALPPLPADHQRPTVEEYVARGYKAEGYEHSMLQWEGEIRRRLAAAAKPAEPSPEEKPPVDGNEAGPEGGAPAARPLDPPVARKRPEVPPRLVDGASEGVLGGPPESPTPGGPVRRYPYTVAEGKSVKCKKGMVGAFAPVRAVDFADGQKTLDELVARGVVDKN